jgi:hypothetical protein
VRNEVIAEAAGTNQYVVSGRINSYEATLVDWLARERRALYKPVERCAACFRSSHSRPSSLTSASLGQSQTRQARDREGQPVNDEHVARRQKFRTGVVKVFKG